MAWAARGAARGTNFRRSSICDCRSTFDRPTILTAVTLASLFEQLKKGDQVIAAYQIVPASSPLKLGADIQIALELDSMGKTDEATKRLTEIIAARPHDVETLSALAELQRSAKKYVEAAATYDQAIAAVAIPQRENWTLFYFRGICYERSNQWPKAEADFKKALELNPDQPMVLNYLGYSWVDKGLNLEEAFKMLRRAVELQPNDGYIVDSLGWAHFKLGQYQEAAQTLEKAIDLKPADPVLNDHLGDAYWRTNRRNRSALSMESCPGHGPGSRRSARHPQEDRVWASGPHDRHRAAQRLGAEGRRGLRSRRQVQCDGCARRRRSI